MKLKIFVASAAVALGTAGAAKAECGDISMTEMDWASGIIVTSISTFLLEQGYGCTVTKVPTSSTPAVASVAETGEPDILTELWTNGVPTYDRLVEEGKLIELTNVLSDGGVEGLWVPKYMVDEHPELAVIEGILANPKLVGGRFHSCPVGWTCHRVGKHIAQAGDFEATGIELFEHGSGETLAASIASAYDVKEPWFGYYWAPTSVLGKYPMVLVDLGGNDVSAHECNSQEDCATPKLNNWPTSDVVTVVTDTFAASHPAETELMSKMSFSNDLMSGLLAWQEENNASGEETAVHFLTNNKDMWGAWLNNDARAELSALLR